MEAERYGEALAQHHMVLREAFARHGGVEVDTQGDAFFIASPTAPWALRAAAEVPIGYPIGDADRARRDWQDASVGKAAGGQRWTGAAR